MSKVTKVKVSAATMNYYKVLSRKLTKKKGLKDLIIYYYY